jgi:hypothetical protein
VRVENNFVLPGGTLPPEPLLPAPAAPIPQGALPPVGTPEYTAGPTIDVPAMPAAASGPLSPVRGREALPYVPQPEKPVTVPPSTPQGASAEPEPIGRFPGITQ